jgi:hypothetical protein
MWRGQPFARDLPRKVKSVCRGFMKIFIKFLLKFRHAAWVSWKSAQWLPRITQGRKWITVSILHFSWRGWMAIQATCTKFRGAIVCFMKNGLVKATLYLINSVQFLTYFLQFSSDLHGIWNNSFPQQRNKQASSSWNSVNARPYFSRRYKRKFINPCTV